MDQFNKSSYKKETLTQQFYHSCLGKVIIFLAVSLILFIVGIIMLPSNDMIKAETIDNVHQCLQDNDSIKGDGIDETISNIGRTFTVADTTLTNPEMIKAYYKYNTIAVYNHTAYSTAYIHNNLHPQGVRVGIGIFGLVISTIRYSDLVLMLGPARGDYNKKLIPDVAIPEEDLGDNPNLKPYHYKGNPDD